MPPQRYIPLSQRNSTPQVSSGVSIPQSSRLAYVNNNPGNLRYAGQIGATEGEGGFAKFNSPDEGYQGLKRQISLDTSRGLDVRGFVSKYAPPTENDTEQYIQQLIEWTGADETTPLSEIDQDKLAQAVARKESSTAVGPLKTFAGAVSKYIPLAKRVAKASMPHMATTFDAMDGIMKVEEALATDTYQKESTVPEEKPKPDPKKVAEAIAKNETGGVEESKRYSFRKFSGSEALGDDLGKYQVTEGLLKDLSPKYLGKEVSPEDFIDNPQLQDAFMAARIINLMNQGYTEAQIADMHRSGNMADEPGGKKYNRPEYVSAFELAYQQGDGNSDTLE